MHIYIPRTQLNGKYTLSRKVRLPDRGHLIVGGGYSTLKVKFHTWLRWFAYAVRTVAPVFTNTEGSNMRRRRGFWKGSQPRRRCCTNAYPRSASEVKNTGTHILVMRQKRNTPMFTMVRKKLKMRISALGGFLYAFRCGCGAVAYHRRAGTAAVLSAELSRLLAEGVLDESFVLCPLKCGDTQLRYLRFLCKFLSNLHKYLRYLRFWSYFISNIY